MSRSRRLLVAALVAVAACGSPEEELMPSSAELREAFDNHPPRIGAGVAEGRAWLEPSRLEAAQIGTFALHFEAGASGVDPGGEILFEFPKSWFALLGPFGKPFQTEDAEAPHHVRLETSRPEAALHLTLQSRDLENKRSRFDHIVSVLVRGESLRAGDRVSIFLQNTTAPYLAGEGTVRVAVDARGYGEYVLVRGGASYRVDNGPAAQIRLTAPSQAAVGEAIDLSVVAFDEFFNLAADTRGRLRIEGLAEDPVELEMKRGGRTNVSWRPRAKGFVWPHATLLPGDGGEGGLGAAGNPIRVVDGPLSGGVFWGDLQVHSTVSKDAIGTNPFEYARDVTRLDFVASTEHSDDDRPRFRELNGILPREWSRIRRQVRDLYEPGSFVPILAYECTLADGHRCVYFRSIDGVPWNPQQLGQSVGNLWPLLEAGQAYGVPHHLGRRTRAAPLNATGPGLTEYYYSSKGGTPGGPVVSWKRRAPDRLQPALEIYSMHGSSEYYDPDDPLSYESVAYTNSRSGRGRHYARNAWELGRRVGVVGGSDNHSGQPGLPHAGLTAARVLELTRDAVFDAVLERRTYATTGERILLEFELAGAGMGDVATAHGSVAGRVLVAAPRDIQWAEVLKHEIGGSGWVAVATWRDAGKLLEAGFEATVADREAVFYLRAQLVGETNGRLSRAWSSPIWVEPGSAAGGGSGYQR